MISEAAEDFIFDFELVHLFLNFTLDLFKKSNVLE